MRYLSVFTTDLPGRAAQGEMAPSWSAGTLRKSPPKNACESAVLAVLTPVNADGDSDALLDWSVLLIRRSVYPGVHSGQISLPGGRREKIDKNLWATACRETFEEVGIEHGCLEKLGSLTSLYIPPSNFFIQPFVALNRAMPAIVTDSREVADYKQIPIRVCDPAKALLLDFDCRDGERRPAPAWRYEGYTIWGATAMILSELYSVLSA